MNKITKYFRVVSVILLSQGAVAASSEEVEREYLTGDWNGARTSLEESGVDLQSVLAHEMVHNARGGVKQGTANLFNYDLTATLDTEKAKLWEGGTAFVYLLGNWGDGPTSLVGDLQASSNYESPADFKVYEAWYDHSFLDGKFAWLVGAHDYNSEFNSLNYASSLVNSSFGISPDISQVGPSIFPTTALGTRVRFVPSESTYIQAAVYDGVPGDPKHEKGTHFKLDRNDGAFVATEVGVLSPESQAELDYYKLALGGWHHSSTFEDFQETERNGNFGAYIIAEKALYHESDPAQGLGGFIQLGYADPHRNEVGSYFGGGLMYTGLFPSREQDITSFGIAHARHGDGFLDASPESERAETALEFNHRFQVLPYLAVQPDYQFIINPGTDPSLNNASVFSMRVEVVM